MKISMSGKMFDARPLEEAIDAAGEIGYAGIELRARENMHLPPGVSKERLREIKRRMEGARLAVTSIASFTGGYGILGDEECRKEYEDFCRYVHIAVELGCDQVRHWAAWKAAREATREEWERAVRWMRKAAEYAEPHGVRVALELHHNTFVDSNARALAMIRQIGMPNVGVIHDAENLYRDGTPYGADALPELAGVLLNVHVKDVVLLNDDSHPEASAYRGRYFRYTLINQGGVDQYSVFRGLELMGYDGWVTVETSGLLTPRELAEHSFHQVSSMLSKHARQKPL